MDSRYNCDCCGLEGAGIHAWQPPACIAWAVRTKEFHLCVGCLDGALIAALDTVPEIAEVE